MVDQEKRYKENKNIGILDPEGVNNNPLTGEVYSDAYKSLAKIWSKFPAYSAAEDIIETLKAAQVTLVISGTGSGKTVLIPKYLLHVFDYDKKIGITLPKKMIAKSAAEFAADTLDVKIGSDVGYQYRGESSKSEKTKLLYCTDGTMVSRLITDPLLMEFTGVIIDEAHERKVNIDFLLYLLRNVIKERPEFKLVIMSATIDRTIFEKYFEGYKFEVVEIGGKTNYPIESIFLDKKLNAMSNAYLDEGVKIIKKIIDDVKSKKKSTGILFFVTSVTETQNICDIISKYDSNSNVCISVFSGMNKEQEKLATDQDYFITEYKTDSSGINKIKLIIATNVAESSLTIEGIEYVIDSGLELRSSYDGVNRVSILEKRLISHAQAKQRMGRTGRTGPGTCYHLYTKDDFDNNMDRFPIPSIRSDSITTEVLRLLAIDSVGSTDKLKKILGEFIEPPDTKIVDYDINYLTSLSMIQDMKITDLGKLCTDLQLEPEESRALIMGYNLFVFREVLAIIILSSECKNSISSLFTLPLDIIDSDQKKDKDKIDKLNNKFKSASSEFSNRYGDTIALLKIFQKFEELKNKGDEANIKSWIYNKFLKRSVLESALKTYNRSKYSLKSILHKYAENHKESDKEVLSINEIYRILASLMYGYRFNEVKILDKRAKINYENKTGDRAQITAMIDPISFIDLQKSRSKSKRAIYSSLFKFNNTPIKIKIVTYESKKSMEILQSSVMGKIDKKDE